MNGEPYSASSVCYLCNASCPAQTGLCQDCNDDLPAIGNQCQRCSSPMPAGSICGACINSAPGYIQQSYAAYCFKFPIDEMVHRLKFNADITVGHILGKAFANNISETNQRLQTPDFIVPTPLHRTRLITRGYNQSLILAMQIGRLLEIPIMQNLCMRTRPTAPQSSLPARQRRKNIRGAFQVMRRLNQDRVLIIDDVITTGSTVNELAKQLLRHGAARVDVWSLSKNV